MRGGVIKTGFAWVHLVLAMVILTVESILRGVITLTYRVFPFPSVLDALYDRSRTLRASFHRRLGADTAQRALGAAELIAYEGYRCEEHVVRTEDGYFLTVHRVLPRDDSKAGNSGAVAADTSAVDVVVDDDDVKDGAVGQRPHGERRRRRPAVLLMHGLMMNSEVWLLNGADSLAFTLVRAGFDVWLGNNRGNKYGCKHETLDPRASPFWDFSLDEFARFDVPAISARVVEVNGGAQCSFVGFSNGSAQMLASLALFPEIEARCAAMVALSPAYRVRWMTNRLANSLIDSNLEFVCLLFGRRECLGSAITWRNILSGPRWVRFIDWCLRFLFNWETRELDPGRKNALYDHLYSRTSTKSVVHWFQIIRDRRFAMYDPTHARARADAYIPVYDVAKIAVPLAAFVGGRDTIIDAPALRDSLPPATQWHDLPTYEHLDTMWGMSAPRAVFAPLIAFLKSKKAE
jgi:lysosomal acid lipase/cholesteryl ester hydrolase